MPLTKSQITQSATESSFLIKDYWIKKLEGIEELQLPKDHSMSLTNNTEFNTIDFQIDKSLIDNIITHFSESKSSTSLVLFAALKVLLYRYSNQIDFCIGTTFRETALDNSTNKDVKSVYLDVLPIGTKIDDTMPFGDFVNKLGIDLMEANSNNQISVDQLISLLGKKNEKDLGLLFPVIFDFQKNTDIDGLNQSSKINLEKFNSTFLFEFVENDEKIEGRITFDKEFFSYETANRMVSHYVTLLESIHSHPSLNLGLLNIIPTEERTLLLETLNATEAEYPHDKTILDLFEEQVNKTPDAIALEFEYNQLIYRQLDEKSNQLANYILSKNIKPESLIPICLDNSLEMIIGILGILKAGGAYVPIDPTIPNERIDFIISDIKPDLILTTSDIAARIQFAFEIIELDHGWEKVENTQKSLFPIRIRQNQPAYVIYTSGSTGKPKGVIIEHRNFVAFLLARISYHEKSESGLLIPSFSFDASISIIFEMLTTGGKLILCKSELIKNPEIIKDELEDSQTILCVPSYYRFLLEENLLSNSKMSKVVLAGENLDDALVKLHFEKTKNIRLFNEYGPTECTVWATVSEIKSPNEKITIGKPIDYTKIYIINTDDQLNPINIPGELCIAGETVGRGYLNLPELTAEKFSPNPFSEIKGARLYRTGDLARWLPDGNIEFLGRIDDQVKLRGYRIELGEIESLINKLNGVKESSVTMREDNHGKKILVAYVVSDKSFERKLAKSHLSTNLPDYMIPSLWVELDKLPLTFNGKINKKALLEINIEDYQNENYEAPKTNLQEQLAAIWQRILGLDRVGIHDDFFSIGGHSLLAVKVISALEKEIGSKVAINLIFKFPSIFALAKAIENPNQNQEGWDSLVPIKPTGSKPPLFIVHGVGSTVSIYYSLAKYIDDDQPIYGFQPKGLNGIEVPNQSVEEMAAFYISLMIRQYPSGPYCIAGYSFGGYVAYEMAHQLKAMGREVSKLILFDTSAYEDPKKLTLLKKIKLELGKRLVNLGFAFKEPQGFYEQKSRSFDSKKDQVLIRLNLKARPETQKDQGNIIKVVAKNNRKILQKYLLNHYDSDLHLFKVKNRSFYVEDTEYYGWAPLVNKVHNVHVSGHHDNIFKKPEILKEMAEKIQIVLDDKHSS